MSPLFCVGLRHCLAQRHSISLEVNHLYHLEPESQNIPSLHFAPRVASLISIIIYSSIVISETPITYLRIQRERL